MIDFVDNLMPDKEGKLRYHFVILDFFVRLIGGSLKAGNDVLDVRWVSLIEVKKYNLTRNFQDFFKRNRELLQRFDSCL